MKKILLILIILIPTGLFSFFKSPIHFFSFGLNVGGTSHNDTHLHLGAEMSTGFFNKNGLWYGVYTDIIRTLTSEETRFSIGPELGYGVAGIDIGLLLSNKEKIGYNIRLSMSLIYLHPYIRYLVQKETNLEFGLVLKLPIPIL